MLKLPQSSDIKNEKQQRSNIRYLISDMHVTFLWFLSSPHSMLVESQGSVSARFKLKPTKQHIFKTG